MTVDNVILGQTIEVAWGNQVATDVNANTAAIATNTADIAAIEANDWVTNARMANNSVNTAELVDGAVTSSKLGADSVNGSKIANDSINSEHYVDGSIDTAHIADNQVTDAKIGAPSTTTSSNIRYTRYGNMVWATCLSGASFNAHTIPSGYRPAALTYFVGHSGTDAYVYRANTDGSYDRLSGTWSSAIGNAYFNAAWYVS